jgi:hypothetical protein
MSDLGNGDSSRVTTFQLYQRIEKMDRENEARIADLRGVVREQNLTIQALVRVQEDHEQRIRSTERWKLSIPVSVLLAVATVVGGFLGKGV